MFLNDGKIVFSPLIILFKFSRFAFCSCVSVCSGLFGCALFGCVAFPFSKVGGSIRLGCCFFLNSRWVRYCLTLLFIIYFLVYFSYFKVRKPTLLYYCSDLVSKSLTFSLKTSTLLLDPYHSFPICPLCRVAPKIAVWYKLVVFPSPCFVFMSLVGVVP